MKTKYRQQWGGNNMGKSEEKRYEKGIAAMQEMFSEEMRAGMRGMKEISPDFWDMIVSFGFVDIYGRGTLSIKQREIITLTTLITQGAFDQVGVHVQAALNVGVTEQEIKEVIIHCAAYTGFPKAIQAMGIASRIFAGNNEETVLY
jgi:4-carboxymuconolactone decarboxylase